MPSFDAPRGRGRRGPVPVAAWLLAIAADLVQLVGFPLFAAGVASPFNDALDVLVSVLLVWMLGWHVALLPALAAELIPVADIAPSWTLAVAIVAFGRRSRPAPTTADAPAPGPSGGSRAEVVEEPPTTLAAPRPGPPR